MSSQSNRYEDGLYPRLLGTAWDRLDSAVQKAHRVDGVLRATGQFRVTHGSGWARRELAWLLGFPAASSAVVARLDVRLVGQEQAWVRIFGQRRLVSMQSVGPRGLLEERFGPLRLRFRLVVAEGGVGYCQQEAVLYVGPWQVAIPLYMTPHVWARVGPTGHPDRSHVLVVITAPCLGCILRYEGMLTVEEAKP